MKRIEFLAPVKAMRGNLSGGQNLTYNGGKRAFDVDSNGVIAAENYQSSYIGAKRNRNGKCYFSLKGKADIALGATNRLAMAAFGGACSLAKAASANLSIVTNLQTIWATLRQLGRISSEIGFVNWIQTEVYPMLKAKNNSVTITDGTHTVTINNPWVSGGSGTAVTIPAEVVSKFEDQLSA